MAKRVARSSRTRPLSLVGSPALAYRAGVRLVRPTRDLATAVRFYTEGLGLVVHLRYEEDDGLRGVVLGPPGAAAVLEVAAAATGGRPRWRVTPDEVLVLHLPASALAAAQRRLAALGAPEAEGPTAFWAAHGHTYVDPDGYRVVLCGDESSGAAPPPTSG